MNVGSQRLMQEYDQCLLKSGYSIEELVDKASDCLLKHLSHYQSYSLLCGPGNNGADGLSLALKLFQMGKDVHVYIFEDENHLSKANHYYLEQCYSKELPITFIHENILDEMCDKMRLCDVIVDAIFGFGLNSSPRGIYQSVIEEVNRLYEQEVIAVDIPTGLNCNNGHPYQSVICATQTITLSALKNGFLNPDSISFTGKVILEKLDVIDVSEKVGLYQLVDFDYAKTLLKERRFDGHKGDYGRIGMITGCEHYRGASLLSTKSAVYSGSGVVTAITIPEIMNALSIFCPEATTSLRPPIFQVEDLNKYDAMLIGKDVLTYNISRNADCTLRLYDYDRIDPKYGKKRELQKEEVIANVNIPDTSTEFMVYPKSYELGINVTRYCDEPGLYTLNRLEVMNEGMYKHDYFAFYTCVNGEGTINDVHIRKGETVFVPAKSGLLKMKGNLDLFLASYRNKWEK